MRYTVVVMVMDSLPSSLLPRWLQMVLPLSDESIRFSWNVPVLSSTTGRPRTLFHHLSFKGFHSSLLLLLSLFWGGGRLELQPKIIASSMEKHFTARSAFSRSLRSLGY